MAADLFSRCGLRGAISGVAIGALTLGPILGCSASRRTKGTVIGHYMDKQAEELAGIEGAKTERLEDEIKITWDSAVLFDFDSAMLKPESQENIKKLADVFVKFPDTEIVVAGHTDAKGSEEYNKKLSERRALSVREYLVDMGVPPSRFRTEGHGGLQPVATNDTDDGRRLNRRVEIEIRANERLKARAAQPEKQG